MSVGVLINHTISFLTSPIAVSLALIAVGLALVVRTAGRDGRSGFGAGLAVFGVLYLWFMSGGLALSWFGLALEREFPPERVESLPRADAVVILGGGMGGNTNTLVYPELYPAADRVVHAARIWKAGKAPLVLASGSNELVSTLPFLLELGVSRDAIVIENKSGNTEENARFVAATLARREKANPVLAGVATDDRENRSMSARPKVLLVTSSWHMRRALLMFRRYAPDLVVIPAACDYEATIGSDEFHFLRALLPSADNLFRNSYMLKEIIGYWGYRIFRR